MKYIDAEKLIAEIERLTNQKKDQLKRFSDEDYTCSVAASINCELSGNLEVLSIIKSLQQEQPEMDLEKELKTIRESDEWKQMQKRGSYMIEALLVVARHFFNLGLNARKDALMAWIDEYKNYSSGPSWDLLKTHIETL